MAEAVRVLRARPVSTGVAVLIPAAAVAVILATTGQTVVAERDVLERIDDAGTRSVVVEIEPDEDVRPGVIDRLARLSVVDWVVGFGPIEDVRNADVPGAPPIASRAIFGDVPPVITLVPATPPPWDDVAWAGSRALAALGFEQAAGTVAADRSEDQLAVVGTLVAEAPLDDLNGQLLRQGYGQEAELRRILLVTTEPRHVPAAADLVLDLVAPADPTAISVQTSRLLVDLREAVAGQLGRHGRSLILTTLSAALVVLMIATFGTVTAHRRDFGRRRALGATRSAIVTVVCTGQAVSSTLGSMTGLAVGGGMTLAWTGGMPDARFAAAVVALAILTTIVASLPPALLAAYQDPVRILRVP